jgi:F420-non-reducing hydrogenase small subunit
MDPQHDAHRSVARRQFAVLQLSGCAGCEVSLLNAEAWIEAYDLVYMPLVLSSYGLPEVDILLVSGSVRNDEDLYRLRRAAKRAKQVVAVGTCAISGGMAHLGDRDEIRQMFLAQPERRHVPHLLPKSHPIDATVDVDLYLPGCPPTPELFLDVLLPKPGFEVAATVCVECGRRKLKEMRPRQLVGFLKGEVLPDICLINQGYLCIGSSTRGGCRALCTRPGHMCVGCRGPSDAFIEKESSAWFASIRRVFTKMTDIPEDEINAALNSPQMALFVFQFSDYDGVRRVPRPKNKVL